MGDVVLNQAPDSTVTVACLCRGRGCPICDGTGLLSKRACMRCGGTGSDSRVKDLAPTCRDCRGIGYRDLDNMHWGT